LRKGIIKDEIIRLDLFHLFARIYI